MSGTGGIGLRGVTRRFGEHVVLDGLDLSLTPGGVTALMGPNGSGKTTVARLLLGLDRPDGGAVEGLDGRPRSAVFQEDRLCPQLSAVDNVRLVLGRGADRGAVLEALAAVGLDDATVHAPVRELSGGQRRRVAIVRAVLADAELVVLDEPFTGLDQAVKPVTMAWVRDRCAGRTVLLVTHDEREAAWFEARVVHLEGSVGSVSAARG
ncbi:ATP-binding cassette domain-containing protein [Cellulomonas sp. 73-145]|uniref:ATP-binding cassette domain-containing protein n=1 Tax=Cellulomonas sp. 73-145 TaxID=1895739 RepID=UPI000B14290C|nr:ATP-binding cassette domain-containing protein [Cellulomonas sp. 73-145]MBN9325687.1 ABC transporter ATP-binding protein [Cellulomonas sp.]